MSEKRGAAKTRAAKAPAAVKSGAEDAAEAEDPGPAPGAEPDLRKRPARRRNRVGGKRVDGKIVVNLALQGGGAHGAFTWGVLDRLLEEDDIAIEGVSGTSAGAMNGAMLTSGLKSGGREEARRRLVGLWAAVHDRFPLNQPPWSFFTQLIPPGLGAAAFDMNPAFVAGEVMTRMISPYQFNPVGLNPLREVLNDLIDFETVCRRDEPRLFVCATDVRAGRARIFQGDEISVDALLASACLPTLFQAVEIDGREYWDGGYTGNPPIWPLIYNCDSEDVLLVHINPIERDETPTDARGIQNRMNEISFNSSLMDEMRAIHTIGGLVKSGALPSERYKHMRIHPIEDPEAFRQLSVATKMSPESRILDGLFEAGRGAMDRWLAEHKDKLGAESSVDVREKYL
ncbi:MAG: patatin-like phospholipase family protein [Pseudomonadota bacterium]